MIDWRDPSSAVGRVIRWGGAAVASASAGVLIAELLAPLHRGGELRLGVVIAAVAGLVAGVGSPMAASSRRQPQAASASLAELAAGLAESAVVDATIARLRPAIADGMVPLAVHIGDEVVEVFWSCPPPPPLKGFEAAATGWVWTIHASRLAGVLDDTRPEDTARVLPGLIAVGVTGLGDLWLNVEALRIVRFTGESRHVHTIASHLSGLLHECDVEMLVVEVGGVGSDPLPGVRVQVSEALDRARRQRAGVRRLLGEHRLMSLPAVRLAMPEGSWSPLVIVLPEADPDNEAVTRLWQTARGERSSVTCLLVGGDTAPEECVRVECVQGAFRLEFLGELDVAIPDVQPRPSSRPRSLDTSFAHEVVRPVERVEVHGGGFDAEGVVLVRVLGPVVIEGARSPMGGKSTELIAYLACNPGGASDERIKEALWPASPVQDKTLHNRVWASRQALGTDPDGGLVFPHFVDGIGRLSASVHTDVDMVESALFAARDAGPDAIPGLQRALGLVRGRPFDERSGYQWAFGDLHVAHAERAVVDAAERLAEVALESGDWRLALWACEQGLLAVPGTELLVQGRMRAFAAGGDLRGVDRAYRDLVASVGDADDVSPETSALYEQLRRPNALPGWSTPG